MSGVRGETPEINWIRGRDDGTFGKVCNGHGKCIDGHLGTGANAAEQLSGANADARINRMHVHAIAPQCREHTGVGGAPADNLGENRRDSGDRPLAIAHP